MTTFSAPCEGGPYDGAMIVKNARHFEVTELIGWNHFGEVIHSTGTYTLIWKWNRPCPSLNH